MQDKFNEDLPAYYKPIIDIVSSVERYVRAEKIICFGCRVTAEVWWNPLMQEYAAAPRIVCNILVLTFKTESRAAVLLEHVRLFEAVVTRLYSRTFEAGVRNGNC